MTTTDFHKLSHASRAECPLSSQTLRKALATALSLGLGMGTCTPAFAFDGGENGADVSGGAAIAEVQKKPVADVDESQKIARTDETTGENETTDQNEAAFSNDDAGADDSGRSSSASSAGSAEPSAAAGKDASSEALKPSSADAGSSEVAAPSAMADAREEDGAQASLRAGETDLGSLWANQDGGTDRPLTITEGGTYRLTADLTVSSALEVKAPGEHVTIDLGSFTLTSRAEAASYLIKATECASLTVVGSYVPGASGASSVLEAEGRESAEDSGDRGSAGRAAGSSSQLVMAGGALSRAIDSAADMLTVRNVSILLKADDAHNDLESLDAAGVHASKGAVSVEQCAVTIDQSNQTRLNLASSHLSGCPRGISLEQAVTSAHVSETDIVATGSRVVEAQSGSNDLTSSDNVYALYSASTGDVVVAGGSFEATSARGTATALCAASLTIEAAPDGSPVVVKADAGNVAAGVRSTRACGVMLDGPMEFTLPRALLPAHGAALLSDVDNGFVLCSRFSTVNAPVLVGTALDAANGDGDRIATFDPDVSEGARTAMAGMLTNGSEDGACSLRVEGDVLCFRLDAHKAPACVVSSTGEEDPCASVAEAFSSLRSGETVKLLQDAGDISIDRGTSRSSFALDLNGHTARSLVVSTKASVRVFSSADGRGSINGFADAVKGAVSYSGSGSLTLESVDVASTSHASDVTALSIAGSGDVTLSDVNVRAIAGSSSVRGIAQTAGTASITVVGGSVSASSDKPGVAAYGMVSSVAAGSCAIDGCTVRAASVDAATGGLDVRGTLDVTGSTVEARTERAASTVWAVRATAASAKVRVSACTLRVLCDEASPQGAYWCLMAGAAAPSNSASWALDGACSFESVNGTHLGFSETPVTVGASFSTSARLTVYGASLDGGIAFVPEEGADLSGLAGRVVACEESPYAGWTLRANEAGALQWVGSTVAQNMSTGASYSSLAEALSEAQAGQTVRLETDCAVRSVLAVDEAVTLDLNGRTLRVDLSGGGSGSALSALSFKGDGSSTVKNGAVAVNVEAGSAQVARDLRISGVALEQGATLVVDDVVLEVTFASAASGLGSTEVAGVDVGRGSLALEGGSRVHVAASGAQAACAVGVDVSGGDDAGTALVARDCSVEVENRAQAQQQGSVRFASTNGSLGNSRLMRVELEEGTGLYEEIQQKFKERALFDVQNDAAGYVYGTRLYYAAPLTLDDGSYVWAFSDPVSATASLDPQNITATHFYFQSYFDAVPDAHGVSADGAGATLRIDGTVSSASSEGNAHALFAEGELAGPSGGSTGAADSSAGFVSVGSLASLTAQGGSRAYRKECGPLDLRAELGLGVAGASKVTYPTTGDYTLVKIVHPSSAAIGGEGASSVNVAAGARISSGSDGAEETVTVPPDYFPESVEVTFTNVRDASGGLLADQMRVQAYGSTLGEGGALPEASDYERDGVTYRFIGWSAATQSSGTRTWASERAADSLVLDISVYANAGNVTLTAEYVPVCADEHLVTFQVDDCAAARAVADGEAPCYRDAVSGAQSSVPAKYAITEGVTYGFAGWTDDASGVAYVGSLPPAMGDCSYTASFSEMPTMTDVSFYAWKEVGAGLSYVATEKEVVEGGALDKAAASVAQPGDVVYGKSEVYEFLGWSPRQSDATPLYTDQLPCQESPVLVGSSTLSTSSALYGIYRVRDRKVDVTFVVDGQPYASAEGVACGSTVNGAFSASGAERPADKSETNRFRGWALGSSDGTLLMGAVKTLADLTEREDAITLYAVFGSGPTAEEQEGELDGGSEEEAQGGGANGGGASNGKSGGISNGLRGASSSAPASRASASAPSLRGVVARAAAPTVEKQDAASDAADENASESAFQASRARGVGDVAESGISAVDNTADEASEGSQLGNAVAFFTGIGALACMGAWLAWRAWRNRRLDAEDDFYEPGVSSDEGEQVVF